MTPDGGCVARASVVALSLVACHSDTAPEPATPPDDASAAPTGVPRPVPVDVGASVHARTSFPPAHGDPCRGMPIPVDQHFVPAGLCARVVASNVVNLRQLTFAPNGDLFAVTSYGAIKLFRDANGDGVYDATEILDYARTGAIGNNCHIADGFLYAGTPGGVMRWPYVAGATGAANGEDVVVGQPSDGHPYHTAHVYDGWLYVHSGSYGDSSDPASPNYDRDRALLRRFRLADFSPATPFAWSSGEVFTVGLRNMVGFTRNASGRMYGVVNGMDAVNYQGADVHQDNPGEQVVELGPGRAYGYPFCFTAADVRTSAGQLVPPGTQLAYTSLGTHDDPWCAANSMRPATFVQAHSAPLDILFFDVQPEGALPARWRGGAFVTLHGSSQRAQPTGYKVVWIPFDAAGRAPMPTRGANGLVFPYEIVFGGGSVAGGPVDGKWQWQTGGSSESPRPVGLAISPVDGALYVSSDQGHLYRVGLQR